MQGPIDAPLTVLVDARNVIRSRWPNFEEERFVELTREWGEREDARLVAVFDGGAPRPTRAAATDERMRIVGTGTESADDWIVREAEQLSRDGGRIALVSSDHELRRRVSQHVQQVIGGGAFATLLESLERSPRLPS